MLLNSDMKILVSSVRLATIEFSKFKLNSLKAVFIIMVMLLFGVSVNLFINIFALCDRTTFLSKAIVFL